VNESTAYRIMRRVETELMESGVFRLPGRKKLLEADHEVVIAVVDVVEHRVLDKNLSAVERKGFHEVCNNNHETL